MKIKEFAQKNGMIFFCSTIILVIVVAVLAGSMFLHRGPRGFSGMRGVPSGMTQRGGYGRQMPEGTQAPDAGASGAPSAPAAPTTPTDGDN